MIVRMANREYPDQIKKSDLDLSCVSMMSFSV